MRIVALAIKNGKNGNGASRATLAHSISCSSSSIFPQEQDVRPRFNLANATSNPACK
ncbi:MAG: hypothetical protein H7A02_03075 [Pseudomonadales bacterium]|nr:hypothetical protein [Pseudomonadales bacterium]